MDIKTLLNTMSEDTNQDDLAAELGVSQATISRWMKGEMFPGGQNLERIREAAIRRGIVEGTRKERPKPGKGDVVQFKLHAGMGSAGSLSVVVDENGMTIDPDDAAGFWSFPEPVKAGLRNLSHVFAIPVIGDSMEPTLPGGSYVFIDTSHTYPAPEDIYAVDYGDGLMVKRVKLVPKTENALIISDNPAYGRDELKRNDVTIHGRVVAWFQWRG